MESFIDDVRNVASLNTLPWDKLRGKNILITGATGLIGSCVVDVLMNRKEIDYHVYASGRNEKRVEERFKSYKNSPFFHFIKYDVVDTLKSDIDFHFIIAGASGASPQLYSTDPVGVMKANFNGVDNLLSYGVRHSLEKFIYISSGEVYGEGNGEIFTEDYSGYVNCATVRACYPSSKRAAETLCVSYSHQYGIDVCIARPCHVYGPNFTETDKRVYAQFIRNVLNNENIVLKSTGSQYRSWCYVVDCVSALLFILLKGENGAAYNIADENSNVTIKTLAEMVAQIGNKDVVFDVPDSAEKAGFSVVTKAVFSVKKLQDLGWNVSGCMKEKLAKVIAWRKKMAE